MIKAAIRLFALASPATARTTGSKGLIRPERITAALAGTAQLFSTLFCQQICRFLFSGEG